MKNYKSSGNDRIKKEFYKSFWNNTKNSLYALIKKIFMSGELPTSQKQAVINLMKKKGRDKEVVKNWR